MSERICFIGGGNMAKAIISGMVGEYCDAKSDADKTIRLWSSPPRMIVQFKRFTSHGTRINTNVNFPINN